MLEVINTHNPYIFALRFPVVAQAANAFMVKVLPIDQYAGFEEMQKAVIESLSREENKQIDGQVYLLDYEPMNEFKKTGPAFKVHVLDRGKEFVCCYVFAESPKAYLWIDFVATKESYDVNFHIMRSLMQDFEIGYKPWWWFGGINNIIIQVWIKNFFFSLDRLSFLESMVFAYLVFTLIYIILRTWYTGYQF